MTAALLLTALNALDDILLVTDAQGCILEANEAAGRLLGSVPDALRGQLVAQCAQHVGGGALSVWVAGALLTPGGPPLDIAVSDALGERVWEAVVTAGTAVGAAAGSPAGSLPFRTIQLRDVTARVRSGRDAVPPPRALENRPLGVLELFEQSGAVQLLVDSETARIVEVNPAAVTFYGWPRATMRAMSLTDLEDVDLDHWRDSPSAMATETGQRVRCTHRIANGDRREVDAGIDVVAMNARRLLHLHMQDITDRVRAEHALRDSEARLRAVIAAMPDGIVLHDDTGAISEYNPTAARMLGLSSAPRRGIIPVDREWCAVHEDGSVWQQEMSPARVALRTGQRQSRAVMGVQRDNGTFAWLHVHAHPLVRPGEQRPYAAVAVFSDVITARSVEERVVEGRQAEAVGVVAGRIAHDFNNLLMVIRGSAALVRESVGPASPYAGDLDAIERATDRAEALTSRLLGLAASHTH